MIEDPATKSLDITILPRTEFEEVSGRGGSGVAIIAKERAAKSWAMPSSGCANGTTSYDPQTHEVSGRKVLDKLSPLESRLETGGCF